MKHKLFLVAFLAQAAFAQETPIGPDVRFVDLVADYRKGVMSQSDQPDIWGDKRGLGAAMALSSYGGKSIFLEFGRSVFEGDNQSRTTQFLAEWQPVAE